MTVALIWVIAFVVILFLCLKRWDATLDGLLHKLLPSVLRSADDRWVWSPAIAVLGATAFVRPVDMLLTLLVIGIIGGVGAKLVCWVMSKVDLH